MLTSLLLGILLVPNAGKDDRDVIELVSGKSVKGRVVLELEDVIFVRIGTRERKIKRSKIKKFSSVFRAQWKVLEKLKKLGRGTTKSLIALAEECQQNNLPHTERLLYWRAFLLDPSNDEVNDRLGHKKRKGKWRIPGRGGALSFDRAKKLRSDWAKAWELRSEHYRVRSSTGLRMVIDTLLDLEHFYHYSMRMWQEVLKLREVLEPMMIHVYKDQHEYPSIASTAAAYFQQSDNTVYLVGGKAGQRPNALFHESTHSFTYNTVSGSSRNKGALPAWLNEGLAEYMQGVISGGRRGFPTFTPGAKIRGHMQTIAGAKRLYDLHRVLNFKTSDYFASSQQDVKYAQGYVLFHYLMHGSTDAMLESFLEYLQAAVAGKGQASTFRRIFRKDLKKIERAQKAYARG